VATVWWRQRATAAWQTFMYLKSSILHRFNRHTSSFLPSALSDSRCGVQRAAMVISGSGGDEQRTKKNCDEREARE
jgi:hypothetical protein